jgi:hypothetical protein
MKTQLRRADQVEGVLFTGLLSGRRKTVSLQRCALAPPEIGHFLGWPIWSKLSTSGSNGLFISFFRENRAFLQIMGKEKKGGI